MVTKKLYCVICNQEINLGEKRIIFEASGGRIEAAHKKCMSSILKKYCRKTTEVDIDEYGIKEEE